MNAESYSPNLRAVVGTTIIMLADFFSYFNDIFPSSKTKGISFPVLSRFELMFCRRNCGFCLQLNPIF